MFKVRQSLNCIRLLFVFSIASYIYDRYILPFTQRFREEKRFFVLIISKELLGMAIEGGERWELAIMWIYF